MIAIVELAMIFHAALMGEIVHGGLGIRFVAIGDMMRLMILLNG